MISDERLRGIALASGFGPTYPDAVRFARAVEREALEEAAKVCEQIGPKEYPTKLLADGFAQAIRALMGNENA